MNLRILKVFCLVILVTLSCKEDEPQKINSVFNLTVKNGSSEVVPHINTYLFTSSSITSAGKDPKQALQVATTGSNGIAIFGLQDVSPSTTIYFTVLERHLDGEYQVLGSLEYAVPSNPDASIAETLTISTPELQYPYGYVPTTIDSKLAMTEYNRWRSTQVTTCNDGLRVRADPSNETRVEGIGFGTILSAYADDQETFDGLMEFYEAKRTTEANDMMAWLVTCTDVEDPGSATDGDIDVAFANIIAYVQWGDDAYLDKAKEIIGVIKTNTFNTCTVNGSPTRIIHPGYSGGAWGGCNETDIQYYTPAFFRVFAEVTGDEEWNELADDSYVLLNAAAHATTGLVPDWHKANGDDTGISYRNYYYGYDACRVPWRMSLDYLWNGNTDAQAWTTKVSNWAYNVGASNFVDGYELDGTPRGSNGLNSAFLGGFTVALMTNDFNKVNTFSDRFADLKDSYWFNLNTRVLYLFTLTGNFWKPELP